MSDLPTSELVCIAWLRAHIDGADIGATLPDRDKWTADRFLQVRALPGGSPGIDLPIRRPVLQIDAWAANTNSGRPQWGKANQLIEAVRLLAESPNSYMTAVILPANYLPARVLHSWLLTEPTRVEGDPLGYARFTADLMFNWTRA